MATPMTSFAKDLLAGKRIPLSVEYSYDEVDGYHIAECLEIPGCMAQGRTLDECKANIAKALEECAAVIIEDAVIARLVASTEDSSRTHWSIGLQVAS